MAVFSIHITMLKVFPPLKKVIVHPSSHIEFTQIAITSL